MKELNEMVEQALNGMHESGALEKIVTEKVEKLVTSVVDDSLRAYSDFGKTLTEHVKGALNVNLGSLSLEGYNDLVLKIIQRMLDSRLEEATTKRLEEDLKTLLADPPKEIKLSELIEKFIAEEAEEAGEDGSESISFVHSDDGSFTYVSWDKDEGKERFQCAYQIGFHNGEAFSYRINESDPKKQMFIGKLYAFDRLMFQIYAAGTKVILDIDAVNIDYPTRDY